VCFNVRGVLHRRLLRSSPANPCRTTTFVKALGISEDIGAVRASLAHYNTLDEIDRFNQ